MSRSSPSSSSRQGRIKIYNTNALQALCEGTRTVSQRYEIHSLSLTCELLPFERVERVNNIFFSNSVTQTNKTLETIEDHRQDLNVIWKKREKQEGMHFETNKR